MTMKGQTAETEMTQYLPPKGDFETFRDDDHYKEKLKEWGLSAAKKELWYKDKRLQRTVAIAGFETYGKLGEFNSVVIEFQDGQLSCIHPAYLKEMQSAGFGKETSVLVEEKDNESTAVEAVSNEAEEALGGGAAAGEVLEASEVTEAVEAPVAKEAPQASEVAVDTPEPKKTKAAKPKKESTPKLELPADKVHFTATVKQFAMTYNHFTEENDEVVILEHVKVMEPELELGYAWCSHSKTLKKFELAAGEQLEFDGKVAAKKLAKGKDVEEAYIFEVTVPYKINNPSKITKVE